jgi:hypothetical protein
MKKLLIILLGIILTSCLSDRETFKNNALHHLNNEREVLLKLRDHSKNSVEREVLNQYQENEWKPILNHVESLIEKLEMQIIKENPHTDTIQSILNDSILKKYSFKEYEYHHAKLEDDELNKLQKENEFLRIQHEIYYSLDAHIMGCFVLNKPKLEIIEHNNHINLIFGIFDESDRPDKIFISSVFLNNREIDIKPMIRKKGGHYEMIFESKEKGIYEWKGGYTIILSTGQIDTLPIEGKFIIE